MSVLIVLKNNNATTFKNSIKEYNMYGLRVCLNLPWKYPIWLI